MNTPRRAYLLILAATTLWCALAASPPIVLTLAPGAGSAEIVYGFFSRICHQLDSHSLHLFGVKFAVCERCFAIYAGALAGMLLAPLVRFPRPGSERWLWLAAAVPMAADVLLDASPWYAASLASRLATGGLFGLSAGILLVPSFMSAWALLLHRSEPSQRRSYEATTR